MMKVIISKFLVKRRSKMKVKIYFDIFGHENGSDQIYPTTTPGTKSIYVEQVIQRQTKNYPKIML